jgi:hypothetical protein
VKKISSSYLVVLRKKEIHKIFGKLKTIQYICCDYRKSACLSFYMYSNTMGYMEVSQTKKRAAGMTEPGRNYLI